MPGHTLQVCCFEASVRALHNLTSHIVPLRCQFELCHFVPLVRRASYMVQELANLTITKTTPVCVEFYEHYLKAR
jgi:hypothetical protein